MPKEYEADCDIGEAVTARLRELGHDAEWDYPGYISIPRNEIETWAIGTADGGWAGNTYLAHGDPNPSGPEFNTGILDSETDVEKIARAINLALECDKNGIPMPFGGAS